MVQYWVSFDLCPAKLEATRSFAGRVGFYGIVFYFLRHRMRAKESFVRRASTFGLLLGVVGISLLMGCSSEEAAPLLADTVPFSGVVKLNGKPMSGGIVTFISGSPNAPFVSGFVGPDGKYSVKTSLGKVEKDGAVPGKYKVTISRFVKPDGEPQDPSVPAEIPGRESLPEMYSSSSSTRLEANVAAGGGTQDFELTAK